MVKDDGIPGYVLTLYADLVKFGRPVDDLACGIFPNGRDYHINGRLQIKAWRDQEKLIEMISIQDFIYLMSGRK